jgi:chemotaxis protein methyltransferase CheR
LLDGSRAAIVGRVNAVFCRNLLIYFDEQARGELVQAFHERLLPGGFLMLGHSESLLHVTTAFELHQLSTDLVYRKPAVPGRP